MYIFILVFEWCTLNVCAAAAAAVTVAVVAFFPLRFSFSVASSLCLFFKFFFSRSLSVCVCGITDWSKANSCRICLRGTFCMSTYTCFIKFLLYRERQPEHFVVYILDYRRTLRSIRYYILYEVFFFVFFALCWCYSCCFLFVRLNVSMSFFPNFSLSLFFYLFLFLSLRRYRWDTFVGVEFVQRSTFSLSEERTGEMSIYRLDPNEGRKIELHLFLTCFQTKRIVMIPNYFFGIKSFYEIIDIVLFSRFTKYKCVDPDSTAWL